MVNYRRNRIPGGIFFFTVTLRDRGSTLLTDQIDLLRESFRTVQQQRPFKIVAAVVLPEHLHMIWRLPEGDDDYSGRWQAIKSRCTRQVKKKGVGIGCDKKGEHGLWQRRFWEHSVRDEADLRHHVDYIHYNPVKNGLVPGVSDWPYSSFHRYLKKEEM